ncbi:MAG: hypothetical protein IKM95_00675 [Bacteroidales bacterium]|nr:hypothetical protein [Bacteroidales bacterium]
MKAILITYNQAYYDEIAKVLNDNGTKGFTEWNEIKGHGSETGDPHYGTHAWPISVIIRNAIRIGGNPYSNEVFAGTRDYEEALARAAK